LSEDATAVLAGEALRWTGDRGFVRACRDVTGGNPILFGELLGTLAADGAGASVDAKRRVRTLQPERVVAEVARRLGRLWPKPRAARPFLQRHQLAPVSSHVCSPDARSLGPTRFVASREGSQ
jgi:hypothetical protein